MGNLMKHVLHIIVYNQWKEGRGGCQEDNIRTKGDSHWHIGQPRVT